MVQICHSPSGFIDELGDMRHLLEIDLFNRVCDAMIIGMQERREEDDGDALGRVTVVIASMFGDPKMEKSDNDVIAEAFRQRLIAAGFKYVPSPLPMRNTHNAIVYYLFFASPNSKGAKIVGEIFDSYRERRG